MTRPRVLTFGLLIASVAAAPLLAPISPAQATTRIASSVPIQDVALAPDGTHAYAVGFSVNDEGKLFRIDLASNSMTEILGGLIRPMDLAITPDGMRIAIGGYGRIYMVDPTNPSSDDSWINAWGDVGGLAASSNAIYASRNDNGTLARIVRGGGGWPTAASWVEIWGGPGYNIWHDGITVTPNDTVLLMGANTNPNGEIRKFVDPLTCSNPCTPTLIPGTNESGIEGIAIAPDGTFAYYARANQASFRRLDLVNDTVSTITGDGGAGSRDVAISADGAYAYLLYKGEHSRNPKILKVRTSDNTVVATVATPVIPCNSGPLAIATSPVSETFMVAGAGYNDASCPTLGGAAYRYPTTPEPPTGLTVASGDSQATVTFTSGADGLSAITNYEYSLDGTTWTALNPADSTSPVTVTGLPNGTAQTLTLRAVNSVGSSDASSAVNVTPVGLPSAPTVTSVDWDDTAASIYFTPPTSNGGAPITTYEYSLNAGGSWNPRTDGGTTESPLIVSGLTTGTTYSVDLRALNSAGGGATQPTPVVVTPGAPHTPPTPPPTYAAGAPTDVRAAAGPGRATIRWSPPSSTGSFPVTHYRVTAEPGGASCLTTTTSCTVVDLMPGSTYTFRVSALNGAGWGPASAPSDPTTLPATAITITGGRSGDGRVLVTGSVTLELTDALRPRIDFGIRRATVMGREVAVDDRGGFVWERRIARAATVTFVSGELVSNALRIPRLR